jgi:8-oxo-dGTP diphosphatase
MDKTQKQFSIAVGVVVNDEGEVLIGKRHQPDHPAVHNKFEFPGGGVEFGENPEETVIREVKEETGLDIQVVSLLPKIFTNIWEKESVAEQVIIICYLCSVVGGVLKPSDPEVSELKFMRPEDIDFSQSLPKTKEIIDLLKLNS